MVTSDRVYRQWFKKSILIFLFLFLTLALIVTWNVPATGYESSIYYSTPWVLWPALLLSEMVGIVFVVLAFSKYDSTTDNLWKYGLLLIFFVYSIILSLFIIRGYYMWCMGGDPASHLGWANEILQTGHLPASLFYPALHIFLSEISLLTTMSPVSVHKILPFFFGLVCVVFTYMFVRILSSNRITPVIAAIISCPFVYSLYLDLTPNEVGNMLIPLALYLMFRYLKGNNASWGIPLCIILVLYPVFHPLPSLVLGVILLTLWVPNTVRDLWSNVRQKNWKFQPLIGRNINGNVVIPFLILGIWFVFWYSSFSLWGSTLTQMYKTISSEGGPSQMTGLAAQINYAQGYGYNVAEIFLKQYGGPFLISVLSVLAFVLLWKITSREPQQENIFSLYGPWAVLCLIVPALFLFNLPFGPLRFIAYTSILGTVFVAFLLTFLLTKSQEINRGFISRVIPAGIVVLLFVLFLSGMLMLYPSPYSFIQNYQTTRYEVAGMANFFEHRNSSINVSVMTESPRRFADLLLTPHQKSLQHLPYDFDYPPWHFGYDLFPSVASGYVAETNLIITKRDRVIYTDYFPGMARIRFLQRDFARLKNDPEVNVVYANGEFDLFTITPKHQGVVV
jgi:hypothetical protein